MRTRMFRRGGTAALFLASVGAAVFGFSTTASAAVVEVEYLNANVKISGDAAVALNKCINDAKDNGMINTQQNACKQTATAGNMVTLSNVSIQVATEQ